MPAGKVVNVDLSGLRDMLREMAGGASSNSLMGRMFKTWAQIYRSDMQERFDRYSKGGGDWPPLAPSTIYKRRHGAGGRFKRGRRAYRRALATGGGQVSVLRDTGMLFAALNPEPGAPGSFEQIIKDGIIVGYGGGAVHPKARISIAELAAIHDQGKGRVPQREIIVEPSRKAVGAMIRAAANTIRKIIDKHAVD